MTMMLSSSSSARLILRSSRRVPSINLLSRKWLSSTADDKDSDDDAPLFLALPETENYYGDPSSRILFPAAPPVVSVTSVQDIVDAVEEHYGKKSPSGVWFVPTNNSDPLHHFESILKSSIARLKQSRHALNVGVYTSGTVASVKPDTTLKEAFSTIHVSLLAATPMDYCEAAGVFREEKFGDVCNFFVDAEEENLTVHAGVLKKFAEEGTELALELGAQHVDVFE